MLVIANSACPASPIAKRTASAEFSGTKVVTFIKRLFTSFNEALNINKSQLLRQHIIETAWSDIKILYEHYIRQSYVESAY